MFIETASGSMEQIHADKNYEEMINISIYRSDGSPDGSFSGGSLKGRGNSTLTFGLRNQTKMPYTLKLPAAAEILGMPTATNWVLMANATDETSLRNKIIYDLAAQSWPEGGHNSTYVDLYLNGEYRGLYLLSEKVESGENRLDIDPDAGDFLCKIELFSRFDDLRNGFFTNFDRAVEVCEPRAMSDAEYSRIISLVNEMEQSLVSGEDLSLKKNLDLDSWAHRYIIDEIAANLDADRASSYFYYKDGVFYAGPLWDYDLSFCNNLGDSWGNINPCIFLARPHKQFSQPGSSYYRSLCENKSFMQRVEEIYAQVYLPVLKELSSGDITELAKSIENAWEMDRQRWLANIPYKGERAGDIEAFLAARTVFLSSAWVEGENYHNIRVYPADKAPLFFSVKDGESFDSELLQGYDCLWLDALSGKEYDFSQAVTDDVYIYSEAEPAPIESDAEEAYTEAETPGLGTREKLTVLSIIAMLAIFAALLTVDIRQRMQERRRSHAKSGKKISS